MRVGLAWFVLLLIELAVLLAAGPALSFGQYLEVAWGASFLAAPLLVAALPLELGLGKTRPLWIGSGLVAILLAALNFEALARGFWPVPLALAGAAVAAAGLARWARGNRTLRVLLVVTAPLAVAGACALNREIYPDRYVLQHLSLSALCLWALALWSDILLRAAIDRGLRLLLRWVAVLAPGAALAAALSFWFFRNGTMDLAAADALSRDLPSPRAAFALLSPLSDRDGDGYGTLLVAADCDDSDPAINPAATEVIANGRDDNCVGGDARTAGSQGIRHVEPAEEQPCGCAGSEGIRHPERVGLPGAELGPAHPPAREGPLPCLGNARRPRAIILLTVDALRPDRVWGPDADRVAPFLHELSAGCVRFRNAWATYASTPQSVFSLLYSRFPSQAESWRVCGHFRTPESARPGLAATLQAHGWRTTAAVGTWMLGPKCGLTREFRDVLVDPVELFEESPRAQEMTALAERALDIHGAGKAPASRGSPPAADRPLGAPVYTWVHYMDPHEPYFAGHGNPGAAVGAGAEAAYNGEVRHVDAEVRKLAASLPAGTVLLVSADHGEEFSRTFPAGHIGLRPEALRVPLLLCAPGLAPLDVDVPVSLLDVGPTVLDFAGIPVPEHFAGRSLLPLAHRCRGATACRPGRGETTEPTEARRWAAAEFADPARGGALRRLVVGSDFRVSADLGLGVFTVEQGGTAVRTATLRYGSPAADAYLELVDSVLAVRR